MQTLRKSHKLRHKSLIDPLFAQGERLAAFPLRLCWRPLDAASLEKNFRGDVPDRIARDQILISVPKKKLRHAVDRVRMRRVVREAYRLNSQPLREAIARHPEIRTLSLGFVFLADSRWDYAKIEKRMKRLMADLIARLDEDNAQSKDSQDDAKD